MHEIGMLASALFSLECLRVNCRHWETKKIFLHDGDSPHLDDCSNHDSLDCCTVSTHAHGLRGRNSTPIRTVVFPAISLPT